MSDQEATVFGGRYELEGRVARGGMADVYRARDLLLDRPVAVKVLFQEFATDPSFVERFRREAQAAANLTHPNIIGIFDWGQEDSTYYIVMEFVEGRSLSDILRARGPLSPKRSAAIAAEVAAALGFAHRNGVVHRDVKPGNVILSPDGTVKVGDFGIAMAVSGTDANLTQTGAVMGTATYFSPEQAQGKVVDQRSDLYSLGVVLYEMLTGAPPFTGESAVGIALSHVQDPPPAMKVDGEPVDPALEAITLKLLAKDPELRYPSIADLQADLQRFRQGDTNLAADASRAAAAGAAGAAVGAAAAATTQPAANPTQSLPPVTVSSGPPPSRGYIDRGEYYDDYDDGPDRRIWGYAFAVIALLAVLVALIVVILNGLNDDGGGTGGGTVRVPSVVDRPLDEARQMLEDAGLMVGDTETEEVDEVEAETVLSQDPAGGTEVEEGSTVDLVYAVGPEAIEVPDVLNRDVEEATRILTDLGFAVTRNDVPDEADPGTVVGQTPGPTQLLPPGGTVVLDVSSGTEEVEIPGVAGLSANDAIEALREAGFTVLPQVDENSDTVPNGQVIRTDPAEGSSAPEGAEVTIFVSIGPSQITVPSVIGLGQADAAATVEAAGLVAVPESCFITDPTTQVPGTIISQVPTAGQVLAPGASVSICIGIEPEPTPTPEPEPTPEPTAEPPPEPPPDGGGGDGGADAGVADAGGADGG